jgi:hypothetical protein
VPWASCTYKVWLASAVVTATAAAWVVVPPGEGAASVDVAAFAVTTVVWPFSAPKPNASLLGWKAFE